MWDLTFGIEFDTYEGYSDHCTIKILGEFLGTVGTATLAEANRELVGECMRLTNTTSAFVVSTNTFTRYSETKPTSAPAVRLATPTDSRRIWWKTTGHPSRDKDLAGTVAAIVQDIETVCTGGV